MLRFKRLLCIIRCRFIVIFIIVFVTAHAILVHLKKKTLLAEIPDSGKEFILFKEEKTDLINVTKIKNLIKQKNTEECIQNIETFGPITKQTNVLVINVHKFSENLQLLLVSLSALKGIQSALIIFSHSYFDLNVNRIISQVDFCRVLQIFYPMSLQVNPDVFPGFNSYDRSDNLLTTKWSLKKIIGSSYQNNGHGRFIDSYHAQYKHHWWWTANKVFESISQLQGNEGIVVFLNQDQYLLDDFLYTLINMKRVADTIPFCEIISLGEHESNSIIFNGNDTYRLEVTTWDSKYSEVIGFDRYTWNTIVSHFDLFCLLEDYSWSRSLQYISLNRIDGNRFKVVSSVMPRSFKTSCGSRGRVTDCDIDDGIFKALSLYKKHQTYFFPPYWEVYVNIEVLDDEYIIFDTVENNGGWNDNRDKELCNNMTLRKVKKILLEMESQFK